MNLVCAQNEFVKSLTRLFTFIDINGYWVTLGEAYRPEWVAKAYSQDGRGIARSLHIDRLAIDLNLFKNEVLLVNVGDIRCVGEFWESLSIPELPHNWGGRFSNPDANHFSVSIDTRK